MPTVAAVRLRYSSQDYWFDPNETDTKHGDHVVVDTARGTEIGLCVADPFDVPYEKVKKPLKPIVRVATDEDLAQADELAEKARQAMPRYRELVERSKLDIKPVDIEYLLDGSCATFYFTSENRVDFRALVRELASEFHVRVDMRQIGPRDEARMLGGLGHCGEELCCARISGDFKGIGIRMAKEQDLSLNPSKISGLCGRLMCCLRYEFDTYKDFKSRAPKKNALIDTPLGTAKVVEFDTPGERVRVRFEDGKSVMLPIAAMDTGDKVAKEGEHIRPCHISAEKFDQIIEELHHDQTLSMMGDKLFSDKPELSDKTAEAGAITRNPRAKRKAKDDSGEGTHRKRRRRGKRGGADGSAHPDERKRRRSVSATKDGASPAGKQGGAQRQGGLGKLAKSAKAAKSGKPRPGQHSSTVSGDASGSRQDNPKPTRRRRRRKSGGSGHAPSGGSGSGHASSDGSAPSGSGASAG